MSDRENTTNLENHLDHRVGKALNFDSKEIEKLKRVFKYFHQLKMNSFNIDLYSELYKKFEIKNDAFKKLLSFNCTKQDSPINKYLDEIWEKRFSDLK